MDAATWSAIAALLTVITAIVIITIQYNAVLESIRPELVLKDWEQATAGGNLDISVIRVDHIKNVGRGVALLVQFRPDFSSSLKKTDSKKPIIVRSMKHFPIIVANEEANLSSQFSIFWEKVPPSPIENLKYVKLGIIITCLDASKNLYSTKYFHFMYMKMNA